MLIDESAGGQTRLTAEGYLEGAPELVIEIAASSAALDLGDKKQAYRRNGVTEYLVWQVFENQIDWYSLTDIACQIPFSKAGAVAGVNSNVL
jgi:Uma2 family endonuclease